MYVMRESLVNLKLYIPFVGCPVVKLCVLNKF